MSNLIAPAVKREINILADMMLAMDGYESWLITNPFDDIFDCSTSTMMRCQRAWNKSVISYAFLNKKPDMLEFQVKATADRQILTEEQDI
tara:strand:+ start:247 stop:516 length:270 start_codon:yes stop_codon:yes gene_type:complete